MTLPALFLVLLTAAAPGDGNLAERNPTTGERVTVEELYEFSTEHLRLDYIFWGTQEPYYTQEILPFLEARAGGGLGS